MRVSDRRVAEAKLAELGVEDTGAALTLIDKELLGSEKATEQLPEATVRDHTISVRFATARLKR